MNIYGMMFEVAPALKKIFELGFLPSDEDFYEFTCEHYQKYENEHGKADEKMYMLLPKNYKYQIPSNETEILTESQIGWFERANAVIERYCSDSGKEFNNYDEKLQYVANRLPDYFAKGTKYQPTVNEIKF